MIRLVYTESNIKGLSQWTFAKLIFLEFLDLSSNLLEDIPAVTFKPLVHLRVLNLTDNKLGSLPAGVLKYQRHLSELYLAKNKLKFVYDKEYAECKELKKLDLSYNTITRVEDDVTLNPSLVELFLNDNGLQYISAKLFYNLQQLETLNLANNELHFISDGIFTRLNALEYLDLRNNFINNLPKGCFDGLTHMQVLNVSKNPIDTFNDDLLKTNLELNNLVLSETRVSRITSRLLGRLKRLRVFNASHNYNLNTIEDFRFSSSNHLQYIDLSVSNLTFLPIFISHLEMVEQLKLDGNPWKCGCKSGWFVNWFNTHQHAVNGTLMCDGSENMIDKLMSLNCEAPQAVNDTISEVREFQSTTVLSCQFYGEPAPSITWITPSGYIYHYYPDNTSTDIFSSHPRIHLYDLDPVSDDRVALLPNGSLQIQQLLRPDAGIYTCLALNSVGNATSHIHVTLDRKTFYHIKIMCIVCGASAVIGVLICTAIGQLISYLCKKCGLTEDRGKQLVQLRENIDTYKSQQLKNLRDNYTQQVHRIKENCAQQVEWIRDSYRGQVKHISDFRHYGSHQFSSIRDQYTDQMKKVKDYSTTQLGWVRENYVCQRTRILKFSSHQVLRFRESYKYQQQTVNKILENLPSLHLENCRGSSCSRSESSVFMEAMRVDMEDIADTHGIEIYVKKKLEEMTDPSVLDEALDEQSVYYTPSELSESPLSPIKDFLRKQQHHVRLAPDLDQPGPSCSSAPWLPDSPVHVHTSHANVTSPDHEFSSTPRTLQTSTSLPEMPQLSDDKLSLETAL